MPRNRPGSCHGALSPLPREVLLTESPKHLWQGAWGELRETVPRRACLHQGLPASAGCGCAPGPSLVPVYLQELPHPVLPVPQPPQVLSAESQRHPHRPAETLCKVGFFFLFSSGYHPRASDMLGSMLSYNQVQWSHGRLLFSHLGDDQGSSMSQEVPGMLCAV